MKRILALIFFLGFASLASATPTGTFTATPSSGPAPLTTTLTWNITGATSCTASGAWTGTKAISGSQVVSGIAAGTQTYTLTCNDPGTGTGTATLSWTPPTTNTDGSALTNLASYEVYRATSLAGLDTATPTVVTAPSTGTTLTAIPAGTWYFGVKAVASDGDKSAMSNTVSKTVGSGASSAVFNVTVTSQIVPNPPVLSTVTTTAVEIRSGANGYWIARNIGTVALGVGCIDPMLIDRPSGGDYYAVPQGVQVTAGIDPATITGIIAGRCS